MVRDENMFFSPRPPLLEEEEKEKRKKNVHNAFLIHLSEMRESSQSESRKL